MSIKGITATVVFESSAVNRGDKIADSITSIKKLSRYNGTFSFMSRAFIRHHLFNTLYNFDSDWEPAPVTMHKKVIQFDFPGANIINSRELDMFGFMRTNPPTVTRKAPLGITKAISLEPWQADMAFYANHDLVKRGKEAGIESEPNPFSKEEHYSFYRVSFTLDLCRLGYHELYLPSIPQDFKDTVVEKFNEISLGDIGTAVADKSRLEGCKLYGPMMRGEDTIGFMGIKEEERLAVIKYVVADEEVKKRVKDLLTVIVNGLIIHSSTENYGLNPLFLVVAATKLPVPLFNSVVNLDKGKIPAKGLNGVAENDYIIKAKYKDANDMLEGHLDKEVFEPWANTSIQDIVGSI